MSDLLREDSQTQPLTIPVLGNTGTYTAPGEDWDGAPVRAELSSGAEAAGFSPDDDLDAEVVNDLIGRQGNGLASIMDQPAINWARLTNLEALAQPNKDNCSVASPNAANFTVAPGVLYSNVDQEVLCQFNAVNFYISYDGWQWSARTAHGVANGSGQARGLFAGVQADESTVSIVCWAEENSGVVRASDNFGSTWYDAGTLGASFEGPLNVGGCLNGRFFICSRSQLYYTDDLAADDPWTRITTASLGWNGAPPVSPLCCETSPTEIAIGIAGAPDLIHSIDGSTWTALALPTSSDGVKALHWSASHKLWIALSNANGRILTAPAGFGSWAERAQLQDHNGSAYTDLYAVCSLGRSVIVAAGNGLWISRDLANWRRLPVRLTADGVNTDGWRWLKSINGKLWAARPFRASGHDGAEFTESATLPAEFTKIGPW